MNTAPPKAVIFDLGKVLLDFDYSLVVRRLAERVAVSTTELRRIINGSALLIEYESGRLTTAEFFAAIGRQAGFTGDLAEFTDIFADIFTEMAPMIELHRDVRRRGFRTYVFSNTNDLAIRFIRRRYPFYADFDGYVLSYEHGAMKPDPALYRAVEELTGVEGTGLFYLDDRPENVDAALERGWRAVVHTTPEASRAALVQAGVLD